MKHLAEEDERGALKVGEETTHTTLKSYLDRPIGEAGPDQRT